MKIFSILFIPIVFFTACFAGENVRIKRMFVYTDGSSTIDTIDFSSPGLHASSLYRSAEIGSINYLTRANSNAIFFDECPIVGECTIKRLSIDHGKPEVFRKGRLPSYVPIHNKLFFYDTEIDGSNWLYEISENNKAKAVKIAKEPKKKTLPNGVKHSISMPVIQISNDNIVYVGEDEQLWIYNIVKKRIIATRIIDCRPILWIEKHNQLLCSDWEKWSLFLIDVNTREKSELSNLNGAYGFSYDLENDVLVYGRTRLKAMVDEGYDIFLYSIEDKKEKRVGKDTHLAAGVWLH